MASAALLRPTMADDDEFVLNLEFAGGKQHAPVQNVHAKKAAQKGPSKPNHVSRSSGQHGPQSNGRGAGPNSGDNSHSRPPQGRGAGFNGQGGGRGGGKPNQGLGKPPGGGQGGVNSKNNSNNNNKQQRSGGGYSKKAGGRGFDDEEVDLRAADSDEEQEVANLVALVTARDAALEASLAGSRQQQGGSAGDGTVEFDEDADKEAARERGRHKKQGRPYQGPDSHRSHQQQRAGQQPAAPLAKLVPGHLANAGAGAEGAAEVFGDGVPTGTAHRPRGTSGNLGIEDGSEDEEMDDAGEGATDGDDDEDMDEEGADHHQAASRRLSHLSAGPGPASAGQTHKVNAKGSKGGLNTKGGGTNASSSSSWPLGPDNWAGLGVSSALAEHLAKIGFERPTLVQRGAIPPLLRHRDALVRAPTGSGKTLSYLIPLVADLAAQEPRLSRAEGTYALVLSPTRELCLQIEDVAVKVLRRYHWLVPGVIIGGENRTHEKARLRKGVTLVVATPGRLLDHLQNTSSFRTGSLRWLVLDEADRLLDLGFEAKLREIIGLLDARAQEEQGPASEGRKQRTSALLSATLHQSLAGLAAVSLKDPMAVGFTLKQGKDGALQLGEGSVGADGEGKAKSAKQAVPSGTPEADEQYKLPSQLRQAFMEVEDKQRLVTLAGLVRQKLMGANRTPVGKSAAGAQAGPSSNKRKAVVFISSCDGVELHHELLGRCWHTATGGPLLGRELPLLKLHGDMPQAQRTAAFVTFSEAPCAVLLCTDVAARGLDFPDVTIIIQYDVPGAPSEYVHRVGRTARIGHSGEAVLMLMPHERPYIDMLSSKGISLQEVSIESALRWLPAVSGMDDDGSVAGSGRANGKSKKNALQGAGRPMALAFNLQRKLMQVVGSDPALKQLASDAFRSYVRAYATHSVDVKRSGCHVKNLHLGHIAFAHGLKDTPTMLGASGSSTERKRKRAEEAAAKQRKAKKSMYHKAQKVVQGEATG